MGSSKKALRDMPEEVVREFGFVLWAVQNGEGHPAIKSWTGAAGVYEIRVSDSDSTFRTVYVANLPTAVYVLHAFQKKSTSGIRTSQRDKDMVSDCLEAAKEHNREALRAQQEAAVQAGRTPAKGQAKRKG